MTLMSETHWTMLWGKLQTPCFSNGSLLIAHCSSTNSHSLATAAGPSPSQWSQQHLHKNPQVLPVKPGRGQKITWSWIQVSPATRHQAATKKTHWPTAILLLASTEICSKPLQMKPSCLSSIPDVFYNVWLW